MFHLRVYGPSGPMTEIGERLEDRGAARHVALTPGVRGGSSLLTAEVDPERADDVLGFLQGHGIAEESIVLARLDEIWPVALHNSGASSLIWSDVLGQARRNAQAVGRYLVLMAVAGVIAGFGVIEVNSTLIVGAMAVSPDFLPVAAACVGLVSGRRRLAGRAVVTLLVGLAITTVAACLLTAGLDLFDLLPSGFVIGEAALSGLTTVNSATIGVAIAAGVAGMLAFETRASAAVGVAISVTTIPAAAYLGVALGIGEGERVPGTLAVLAVNVTLLVLGGVTTLIAQRWIGRHAASGR
jgi:uncharacterized hydrophobic protein (TIGR00271 family)